jgi:hypothetical protein
MKVFLAGTFGESKHIESVKKSPYLLESFYYIQSWQIPLIKNCKMFLLDSGAFTFMQNSKKNVDWDEYLDKYIAFINTHDVQYFFELDIDAIVGYERVKQLRKRLETETRKKCIPVWHKSRGKEEWLKMCEEYDYVAIGGIASKEIKPKDYPFFSWLIREARLRGAKVHGLGFTNIDGLQNYHFFSVDSTRWNCARFGRLEYFDGKKIQAIDRRKTHRLKGRSKKEIIEFTFAEWVKFQNYAETHL